MFSKLDVFRDAEQCWERGGGALLVPPKAVVGGSLRTAEIYVRIAIKNQPISNASMRNDGDNTKGDGRNSDLCQQASHIHNPPHQGWAIQRVPGSCSFFSQLEIKPEPEVPQC